MKAVVVEIRGKLVAALSDDGCVVKVPNQNYVIGQVITMKKMTSIRTKMLAGLSAAAAFCLLLCGVSAYAYYSPSAYVSMDVNPSVEYTLNAFDRVLSVNAVNDDGTKILQEISLTDLTNKTIDDAISLTLAEITKEGYFDGNLGGGIMITASGSKADSAEKLAQHLKEFVSAQCAENQKDVSVEAMAVDQTQLDEAKSRGITPGKLLLMQQLQASYTGTEPFNAEEWLTKPVKDIMAELERLEDVNDPDDGDADDDSDDATDDDTEDDASDAAEDAADAAKDAEEEAAEKAENAADDAKEAEEEAADAAEEAADIAKEKEKAAADEAKEKEEAAAEAKEKEEEAAAEAKEKEEEAAAEAKEKEEAAAEAKEKEEEASQDSEPEEDD